MIIQHFGKSYKNEKAIIALTSWRLRINTVGNTIFNLLKVCAKFHIVLTLSEKEFPRKELDLPPALVKMAYIGLFEILWVRENWKSFKKILPCMTIYPTTPIISADDDCIYKINYAECLYDRWIRNRDSRIGMSHSSRFNLMLLSGCACLYPPACFAAFNLEDLNKMYQVQEDDMFYSLLSNKLRIPLISLNYKVNDYVLFANDTQPLSAKREYGDKSDYYKFIEIFKHLTFK
jgi:hypothetical protein